MDSPDLISNASYWQYKDDTSYVLKWIEQTAKACGWKRQHGIQTTPGPSTPGPQTAKSCTGTSIPTNKITGSGRVKGKERKAAKRQAAANEIPAIEKKKDDDDKREVVFNAVDILSQANLISTCLSKSPSSVSRPPASVMHALSRAIKLRQKFSDWFETARPNDHKSNSAHRYFVKVLEKIANIFLQATGATAATSNEDSTGSAVSGAGGEAKPNRYEYLLEQSIQEEPENDLAQSTESSGQSTAGETTTPGRKYHMEIKGSQENALMVFTLFTDLHDIKAELKSLWKRCFRDGADTVAATLLTAQTMGFVQGLEETAMSALDPAEEQPGVPGQTRHQNQACSFQGTFRGTYFRFLDILRDPNDAKAVIRFENSSYRTRDGTVHMNDLTFAFSARRLNGLTCGPLGVNGEYCEPLLLHFKHNPKAMFNSEAGGKIIERDENLCCLLAELAYLNYVSPSQGPHQDHSERARRFESFRKDPIMGSLHPVWTRQEVNLTSVLAAEVMLDINELSYEFPAARPSYDATYDKYMSLLSLKVDTEAKPRVLVPTQDTPFLLGGVTPGWDSKVKEAMDKILCMLPVPNTRDNDHRSDQGEEREPTGCEPAVEMYKEQDPLTLRCTYEDYLLGGLFDVIWLPIGVHFFFDHYPMFCTHREAFMQTLTESIGIEIMNAERHGVGAMAHLYNASRQLGLGNLQWPAMDHLIELHKVALFAGDPPTTPAAMLKCFSHRYWGPNRPMSRKKKTKIMNRAVTQMKPSATAQAFAQHWDTAGRIPFWYTLEANALSTATAEKKPSRKKTPTTKNSFVENMPVMEEYLAKQLRDVRLDYFEIDRFNGEFNRDLLKHARRVFEKQLSRTLQKEELDFFSGIDFVSQAFEQEAYLHGLMVNCDGDSSKLPVQDCDYLQDSINCLANILRSKGISQGPATAAGDEGVNMPTSLKRFRTMGSEGLSGPRPLVLVSNCTCCNRTHYI